MTKPSIEVDADNVRKALKGIEGGVKDLKVVHKAAGEVVVADARPRARRLTGAMAASGRAAGQAKQGVVRFGFARLPYVPIQIFGAPSRNISPNPFPYEAVDASMPKVIGVYEDGLDEVIKKHGL